MKKNYLFILAIIAWVFAFFVPATVHASEIYTNGYFKYTVTDNSVTIVSYFGNEEEVTVPNMIVGNPVNVLAKGAFSESETVKKVFLPDTIMTVEEGAFGNAQRKFMPDLFELFEKTADPRNPCYITYPNRMMLGQMYFSGNIKVEISAQKDRETGLFLLGKRMMKRILRNYYFGNESARRKANLVKCFGSGKSGRFYILGQRYGLFKEKGV